MYSRRILVLEDEDVLRSATVRALAKLDGVEVLGAGTVEEAVRLFRASVPEVVVSDLDLPDGSGLQLLGEIERAGGGIPVIFVSAYIDRLGSSIPRRSDIVVRSKPLELETLRGLVRESLKSPRRDPSAFTVDDYVELACMGRHAVLIKLEDSERLIGEIYVRSGEVWTAIDAEGRGELALDRLRASPAVGVECAPLTIDLVLERAVTAVLEKDYDTALDMYVRADGLSPGDPKVRANIERLLALIARRSSRA